MITRQLGALSLAVFATGGNKIVDSLGGSATANGVALDSSGNLYAGLSGNLGPPDAGGVRIYTPPFSAASAPSATTSAFGTSLAVGK